MKFKKIADDWWFFKKGERVVVTVRRTESGFIMSSAYCETIPKRNKKRLDEMKKEASPKAKTWKEVNDRIQFAFKGIRL